MAADSISAYQRLWAAATPQSCRAAAQIASLHAEFVCFFVPRAERKGVRKAI